MICPKCKSDQLHCVDSRPAPDSVRRRRECPNCGHRFSTIEIQEERLADLEAMERTLLCLAKTEK